MQKILFPMQYMRITTGINEMSHKGSNALDIAGKDTGIESAWAPFTGTVKKIYALGHTVWLQSNDPVIFADGTVDFATVSMTHDNIVSDLKVGQVIQQGQLFYQEGTSNASGNHIHLEIGKGKFTGTGWYMNAQGNWVINNSYVPYKAFWLDKTNVINGYNYPWKKVSNKDVIGKDDIAPVRVVMSEVEGWDMNNIHSGKNDAEILGAWYDHSWQEFIMNGWAKQSIKRGQLVEKINGLNSQISELQKLPKEITVEKTVEVVKEVIKEVPVERIVYQDKIVEVVKGDDERSLGDLLSASFKKLFKIK
jgi:hypothetical protein